MPIHYLLKTDGTIEKRDNAYKLLSEFEIQDLGYNEIENIEASLFIFTIADEYNLLMHPYNHKFDYELPVNKALKVFFPESEYMGDIIIAKTDDYEFLIEEWALKADLKNFKAGTLDDTKHIFIESRERIDTSEEKFDQNYEFVFYTLD